ncbi:MAG: hypothetical protein K6B15_00325 [Parasporobacterium sp.]|nr:hypothetical protein [Parasporobacterium sp.]
MQVKNYIVCYCRYEKNKEDPLSITVFLRKDKNTSKLRMEVTNQLVDKEADNRAKAINNLIINNSEIDGKNFEIKKQPDFEKEEWMVLKSEIEKEDK